MGRWGERIDLQLDGVWTDITGRVYNRDPIVITRGRSGEGTVAERSSCTLTLNNRDGWFSQGNPRSPYYEVLTRNTPLRVWIPTSAHVWLPGGTGDRVTTGDDATHPVGDLDVRVEATLDWSRPVDLAAKYVGGAVNQRSWGLSIGLESTPTLIWSPDGTFASLRTARATEQLPPGWLHRAVRAVLDVDNGAGGWTVTFYVGDTVAGPWTQIGAPVTGTGVTSVFDSTAPIEVGATDALTLPPPEGRLHAFELRSGIGGTAVASWTAANLTVGATSFVDDQGRTWTVGGNAEISNRDVRFVGEVARWPVASDRSGRDVHVKVTASGIMRRLQQGPSPLQSPARRDMANPARTDIAGYWPCEDDKAATALASALPNHPPMRFTGAPALAEYSDYLPSGPLPLVKTGRFHATVPTYTETGENVIRWYARFSAAPAAEQRVMVAATTGTAARWELWVRTTGGGRLLIFDRDGIQLADSGWIAFDVHTSGDMVMRVFMRQSGANVDWVMGRESFDVPDATWTDVGTTGTLAAHTAGRVTSIQLNPDGNLGDVVLGHLVLANAETAFDASGAALTAHTLEPPADRVTRLCAEENIPLTLVGPDSGIVRMGAQSIATLMDLLREAETADIGILHEPRHKLGLAYRTREGLYAQTPAVVLDYAAKHITGDLAPVDDDQATRNDIEVKRPRGSSYRAVLESGPLSVQAPPAGVGRYDESIEVNVGRDLALPDQAGWRLHLGTWDEPRYPTLEVHLANPHLGADLVAGLLALDVGDRIRIDNPPDWLPAEAIDQIVAGTVETITLTEYKIRFNLVPARPWDVASYEQGRRDTAGSELAAAVDADDTTLTVATTVGPAWTTNPADLPLDIVVGGERMTVTAITGAASPQTFTVTRSVNGISKAHAAGASVSLADRAIRAL